MDILNREFYSRNSDKVAKELLGKLLVRKVRDRFISGFIVETEAYFDKDDPASRAAQNGRTEMTEAMWGEPGTIFVYMVHGHWMFNVVTDEKDKASAVLFRALKPLDGIDFMRSNRNKKDIRELCSGPGKLTQAFDIDKSFNRKNICELKDLSITDHNFKNFELGRSKRVGVSEDLDEPMRFFVKDSKFVSR